MSGQVGGTPSAKKKKKVSLAVATIVAAVVSGAAAVITGFVTSANSKADIWADSNGDSLSTSFSDSPPRHLSDGDLVDTCVTVRGDAALTGDQAIAVGTQATGDRWYWEGHSVWDDPSQRHWHADLHIGDVSDHRQYKETVTVIVAPTTVVDYLKSTNKGYPTETWWSSPGMPPDVLAKDSVVVTRTGKPGKGC